jgi:hypothetical protein
MIYGLTLQRDIHVKVMNKVLPKFTTEFVKIYNDGMLCVSCKVKINRVRKYTYNYNPHYPRELIRAEYEVDIIVSDLEYVNANGTKCNSKVFIDNNKSSYNRALRSRLPSLIKNHINLIDSKFEGIKISKIEYNL